MSWIVALLFLSLMIFLHELGHYLAARAMGVYVEVFSIGFGPSLGSLRCCHTRWQLSLIPLGGYVKMRGQDDLDPNAHDGRDDSYNAKAPWQRIIILVAGPLGNFLLAWGLFYIVALGGPQSLAPRIGYVVTDSPAYHAGLRAEDRVIAIDHRPITTWDELSRTIKHSGQPTLTLSIQRQERALELSITPQTKTVENLFHEKITQKMIGIAPSGAMITLAYTPITALEYATQKTYEASILILKGVEKLLTGVVPAKEVGGVVSIVQITADASQYGWIALLMFSALISVNLGILNLFPIPALDGGHILFNLYEMITSRAPSDRAIMALTLMGWVLLIALMLLGLYNDITRLTQ